MGTTGTSVQAGSPEQFATAAGDAGDRINGMLTQLMNGLAPLESTWKGIGGQSFQQVKATVETEAKKLSGALHGLGSDIGMVGKVYASADSDQGQQMNTVASETSGITAGLTLGGSA